MYVKFVFVVINYLHIMCSKTTMALVIVMYVTEPDGHGYPLLHNSSQ